MTTTEHPVAPPRYALDDKAREQIRKMLDLVAVEKRECHACSRMLWMVVLPMGGKKMPFSDDAVSHFADCTEPERFRRGKQR